MYFKYIQWAAIAFLGSLLLAYCTEQEEINFDYSKSLVVKITPEQGGHGTYKASDLFDSITITPIKIDSNTLMSKIDKVFFVGDTIIVVDQHVAKRILAYASDGHLLYEFKNVDNSGFTDLSDVIYNEDRGLLEIFDGTRNRIVSYDIRSGSFIGERKCNLSFFSFYYLGKGAYAYYTHFNDRSSKRIKHNLIIEDSTGKYKKFLPYFDNEVRPQDMTLSFKSFFSRSGRHYFAPHGSRYIYEVHPEGMTPAATLDFGGSNVDIYGGLVKQPVLSEAGKGNLFAGDIYFLAKDKIYFTYRQNDQICGYLYTDGKSLPGITRINNDLGKVPVYTTFIAQTDSCIVQFVDVEELNASAIRYKDESKEYFDRMKAIVNQYPGCFLIQKLYFRQ